MRVVLQIIVFLVLTPVFALILYSAVRGGLNYAGHCWEQQRFLSEEEKIVLAADYINVHGPSVVDFKVVERIPYKSGKELLEQNPDCCEIVYNYKLYPYGHWPELNEPIRIRDREFFGRIMGVQNGTAVLRYKNRYADEDGAVKEVAKISIANIANCGSLDTDPTLAH